MDASEQAAVAEFILGGVGGEAAAHEVTGRLRTLKAVVRILRLKSGAVGEVVGGDGAEALGVAADEGEPGRFAVVHLQESVLGDGGGGRVRIGEEEADGGKVFDSEPEGAVCEAEPGGPASGLKLSEPLAPGGGVLLRDDDEAEESVVRFLGVAEGQARLPRGRGRWRQG